MKKLFIVVLALALFFTLASCGSSKDAAQAAPAEAPKAAEQVEAAAPAVQEAVPAVEPAQVVEAAPVAIAAPVEAAPAEVKDSDEISVAANGYEIEFLSAKLDKDYSGNEIVLIKYRFTNNSGPAAAFWQVFNESVSQDGKAMSSEGIVLDYSVMAGAYETVEQGHTAVCCYAYPFFSKTDPIDLTIRIYNYSSATTIASASGQVYIEG